MTPDNDITSGFDTNFLSMSFCFPPFLTGQNPLNKYQFFYIFVSPLCDGYERELPHSKKNSNELKAKSIKSVISLKMDGYD